MLEKEQRSEKRWRYLLTVARITYHNCIYNDSFYVRFFYERPSIFPIIDIFLDSL